MQKKVKDIIKEVCKKHNIPEHIGVKVHAIPWKIVREKTAEKYGSPNSEDYPTIKIPGFGTFETKQSRLDKFFNNTNKEENENGGNK